MCPICWATALVTFSGLLALSVVSIAAPDAWTLAGAAVLGGASIVHRVGIALVPWWFFAVLSITVVCRIAWLMVFTRHRLFITRAWALARHTATGRCPNRES